MGTIARVLGAATVLAGAALGTRGSLIGGSGDEGPADSQRRARQNGGSAQYTSDRPMLLRPLQGAYHSAADRIKDRRAGDHGRRARVF